jgi:hypothetical protein
MTGAHVAGAPAIATDRGRVLQFLVVVNPRCQRQPMTAVLRAQLRTGVVHLAGIVASAPTGHR